MIARLQVCLADLNYKNWWPSSNSSNDIWLADQDKNNIERQK